MAYNYGKQFEDLVKKQFCEVQGAVIERLYDNTAGFHGINNICDFIGYIYPNIFFLEVKVVQSGNTFPLDRLTQYEKLLEKSGVPGVRSGVIIWFMEKQKIVYVPVTTFKKLHDDGKKSVNIKYLESNEYRLIEIPSTTKRVFMRSDYSVLKNLQDNN